MKRIMVCALLLLPLIVLLIMFVSATVVGNSTYIYVQDVEFVQQGVTLQKTDEQPVTMQLSVNVFPLQATDKTVEFYSADESIAAIDQNGVVCGVNFGETYVYVRSKENSTKQASCKVVVTDDKIHQIEVLNAQKTMVVGQSVRLEWQFLPKEAVDTRICFLSSDSTILSVSDDGELVASTQKVGTVTVVAYSQQNPQASVSFDVKVTCPIQSIALVDTSPVKDSYVSYDLPTVAVLPTLAQQDAKLHYTVDDGSVAYVDEQAGKLVFVRGGTVNLTVSAEGFDGTVCKTYTSTFGHFDSVRFDVVGNQLNMDYDALQSSGGVMNLNYLATPTSAQAQVSTTSSNTSVVKIVDGKFVVVGGGSAVLTISVVNAQGQTVSDSVTVNVNRNATKIQFVTAVGETKLVTTLHNTVNVAEMVTLQPSDNTDSVSSYVIEGDNATVTNGGVVRFNGNKACKTDVTVTLRSGLTDTLTVVYLPEQSNPVNLQQGNNQLTLYMPASNQAQQVVFTPYVNVSCHSISVETTDGAIAQVDDQTVVCTDKGTFTVVLKVDGQVYATLDVTVVRLVERVDVAFSSVWGDEIKPLDFVANNDYLYTSAKTVSFAYTTSPSNATANTVDVSVSGEAKLIGSKVIFDSCGYATVNFSVDNVSTSVKIFSTYGLFDDQTEFLQTKTVDCDTILSVESFVTKVSPYNADVVNLSLSVVQGVATVDGSTVHFVCGGDVVLQVSANGIDGAIVANVSVHVNEQPTEIQLQSNVLYTQSNTVDLSQTISVLPTTANYKNNVSYNVVSGSRFATISNTTLIFDQAGLCVVEIATENGLSKQLTVVYTANYDVVHDGNEVEIGKSFILQPTQQQMAQISGANAFTTTFEHLTVTNGCVLTLCDTLVGVEGGTAFDVSLGNVSFRLVGIVKGKSVAFDFDSAQLDVDRNNSGAYVTALSSVYVKGFVTNDDVAYKQITYSLQGDDVATYDEKSNTLSFFARGTVVLCATDHFGKTATITICSTLGQLISVTATNSNWTIDYDQYATNGFDVSLVNNAFVCYPSQAVVSADTLRVLVDDKDFSVNGVVVGLSSVRKDFVLKYAPVGASNTLQSIDVTVNRKANSVSVNGIDVANLTHWESINKAFVALSVHALPIDSNVDNQVSCQIADGAQYATLVNNRLVFRQANQQVTLRFTVGQSTHYDVVFVTTNLTETVDVNTDIVVVPYGVAFSFDDSSDCFDMSTVSFVGDVDFVKNGDNYTFNKAGVFALNIVNATQTVTKRLVVTRSVDDLTGVALSDVLGSGASTVVPMAQNAIHITASQSVGISCDVLNYAYNVDGTQPVVSVSVSNSSVATVVDGVLVFSRSGQVTVTLSIVGNDYFSDKNGEPYTRTYSFDVYSSMGAADGFSLQGVPNNVVLDQTTSFDLAQCVNATSPSFGVLSARYSYSTSDSSVATVGNDGVVTFVGTGRVTVSVSTMAGNGSLVVRQAEIVVDKYVDSIAVLDGDKQRTSVVTHDANYHIDALGLSNTIVAPTLTNLAYTCLTSGATVDSYGNVTLGGYGKYLFAIAATRSDGVSVVATFTILRVSSEFNILLVDDTTDYLALSAGNRYVIDAALGVAQADMQLGTHSELNILDENGVFATLCGGAFDIDVNGNSIAVYISQPVQSLVFDQTATNLFSAKTTFDLQQLFGATYLPTTARQNVYPYDAYTIVCTVDDTDTATVSGDGVLTFRKAGIVNVTFSAGSQSKTYKVESTFGYAKNVTWLNTDQWLFEFASGSYTLQQDRDFVVYPSDATLHAPFVQLTDGGSVQTDDLTLQFVGGGESKIALVYKVSATASQSIARTVQVVKRAEGVVNLYNEKTSGYVVVKGNSVTLSPTVYGQNLSPYTIKYVVDDSSVATVDSNGKVTFVGVGNSVTVTLNVTNLYTNEIDATVDIVVCNTHDNVVNVSKQTDKIDLSVSSGTGKNKVTLLPQSDSVATKFSFEIVDQNGNPTTSSVVSVDERGNLVAIGGGYARVKVSEVPVGKTTSQTLWQTVFQVFVHKNVSDVTLNGLLSQPQYLDDNGTFVTSKDTLQLFDVADLSAALLPTDACFEKTFKFECDSNVATVDGNGTVTFLSDGKVSVTVSVLYNGEEEFSKKVSLRSTLGKATSVVVTESGKPVQSNYTLDVGNSVQFVIDGVFPPDLDIDGKVSFVTGVDGVVSVDVSGNVVTIVALERGVTEVTVNVCSYTFTVTFQVLRKSQRVDVLLDGNVGTSVTTLTNVIPLSANVYPVNASNTTVVWSVVSGSGAVVVDGSVTLPKGVFGTYVVKATATDGASYAQYTIVYVNSIDSFTVSYSQQQLTNGQQIYLAWNVGSLVLQVLPTPTGLYGFDYADFSVSSNYCAFGWNGDRLTVTLPDAVSTPHVEDTIVVKYGDVEFDFYVYRSGVKKIEFVDHDNVNDTQYGLQQMRLFGNQSYYGKVVAYYKMPVNVSPSNALHEELVWTTSDPRVTVESYEGYVYILFNGFVGSSLEEILADNFVNGLLTVTATDMGNTLSFADADSYTFHVVSAVNVFDKEGFLNAGNAVVLHTNFGNDDEAQQIANGTYQQLNDYRTFTTVYGNGYTVNFAYRNSQTSESSYKNYNYITVSIKNVVNLNVKGGNNDTTKQSYNVQLSGVSQVAYCEMYNMYRAIENYGGTVYVKRCLFRNFKEEGLLNQADGSTYLEDVIMFDVGTRAIELHTSTVYVKGFLDVYNFQNKDAVKDYIAVVGGSVFDKIVKENSGYIESANGENWINMVALSAKGNDRVLKWYDETTQSYKDVTTTASSPTGLGKMEITVMVLYKMCAWSYPNTSQYIRWSDQYNADGTLNSSKMIATTHKIQRLQGK